MKILAFSDLHLDTAARDAILNAAAEADLVIGAGDFASAHQGLAEFVAPFDALAGTALFTCGNNETLQALRGATRVPVLHGEVAEVQGLRVAGIGCAIPPLPPLPWQSHDLEEEDAAALLAPIDVVDILISHSPPHGACDRLEGKGHIGSVAIREAAERMTPRFLFCGHVHDDWGARSSIGACTVANLGPGLNWFETA